MRSYLSLLPLGLQTFFAANSTLPETTSTMPTYPSAPAWKPALADSLASQPVTFFQLATVSAPLVPSCRTMTLSGFFGETPYAADSAITERNPEGAESDVLYVASDSHAKKFSDLAVSSAVEAVFFFPSLWSQIRIKGNAYAISPNGVSGEAEVEARKVVESHMKIPEGWDWEKELVKVWERQDEKIMKSKFPPTTPEKPVPEGFRLIVIVPEEVQQLLPGKGLFTWTATVNNGTAEWVRNDATAVKAKL